MPIIRYHQSGTEPDQLDHGTFVLSLTFFVCFHQSVVYILLGTVDCSSDPGDCFPALLPMEEKDMRDCRCVDCKKRCVDQSIC